MQLDAPPDGDVERLAFRRGVFHPVPSVLRQSFAAMLIAFRVALLPHGISTLSFERELPQQSFDALEPLVAFDREMEGLALQCCMARVQEGDHGRRFAEMTPRGL